jgi:hypothetical protein
MNKKKFYKYLGITFILFFLSKIVNPKNENMLLKEFKDNVRLKLIVIIEALQNLGLNSEQVKFALSQILLETGQFGKSSNVVKLNNNYSGIKFINKPYQVAVKGSPVPPGERVTPESSPINFYAKFSDVGAWAKDYVRILNLKKNKPLQAVSIDDFHKRLTANKYYDTSNKKNIDNYLKNLHYFYARLV